ncbi:glycosyltransferase [Sphingobium sp. CR2-8]|uniref:glycosyltransferase family 2 protein n=1 Tax=Sphingobium sp. CR2-8 TaxID=1306534 RepID=UPI002DB6EF0D|nr:glycosyltransferase [Sphingobium sp. CR2-8]MEC3912431.1 glycosyltransferase [Sphingobium sp. CR2-8]
MSISVLTIVKNRAGHLAQLVEGLRRSAVLPDELIIVDMGSDSPVAAPDCAFPVHVIRLGGEGLPLAAARNAAARAAVGDHLLFLDVDCIPMRDLVGAMRDQLDREDHLFCAEAFYLGPTDARGAWDEELLKRSAMPHPVRAFPATGVREEANAGLFWSLIFGIRRVRFIALGGFDEAFTGYGAEDTDFGFRAQRAGLPLMFIGGPGAFHQYHDVLDPPLQHFGDIVHNARRFHKRWQFWPMEGWLRAFADMGFIRWSDQAIVVLRRPDEADLTRARRASAA